mmetsp:Transcript_60789/g.131868  ORF Transcript_60789/g.131868 Transcript_60789/m.131868 type:complete len:491 (+) Transcript_60789:469-1941(+)
MSSSAVTFDWAARACTVAARSGERPAGSPPVDEAAAWPDPSSRSSPSKPPPPVARAEEIPEGLEVSKESWGGNGWTSICFEKSVGGGGSSSRLRRSKPADGFAGFFCEEDPSMSSPESMSCGSLRRASRFSSERDSDFRGFRSRGESSSSSSLDVEPAPPSLSLLPRAPVAPLLLEAASAEPSAVPASPRSRSRRCAFSACALRMALSFWTRFTVVGIRTLSACCFFLSPSSAWPPLMSQSSASCVLFWWRRSARLAGPSSNPCDSNEDRDNGSTGIEVQTSPFLESSLAFLSMSLVAKSATVSSPSSSLSWSSISTCASRCSGVISTIGRNSMRIGNDEEIACADVAKNSYCRYFNVCRVESRMSPRYSSKMYSHSKTCLSTSLKLILADSKADWAWRRRLSVLSRFFLTQSSNCFLALFSSMSRRLRTSKLTFKFRLLEMWLCTGVKMLKCMSRRSLAIALWGASLRAIWFVASLSLQLSEAMCESAV